VLFLQCEDFYFDVYSCKEENPKTGATVNWSFGYGIEASDGTASKFFIHKKRIQL
jgi:hypothetical protein